MTFIDAESNRSRIACIMVVAESDWMRIQIYQTGSDGESKILESAHLWFVLDQWFSNCGTRTTSGKRRPSRWYAKTFKVVREEAYFLFFFTKNIFTAVVFTSRVLLINS